MSVISKKLQAEYSDAQALERQLLKIPQLLHIQSNLSSGYGAGTWINLCIDLQVDLSGYAQPFGSILSVVFSSDGQLLATGDTKGEVALWQTTEGEKFLTCTGHTNWV